MAKKLLTSPKGTAVWPWLHKPDTKFKAEGQYKVGLRLKSDDPGAIKLMKQIDDAAAQSVATAREAAETPKAKKLVKPCEDKPYSMETDDDDNETGYVVFNFKMTASGKSRATGKEFTMRPALFDGTGTPLDGDTQVGGGSVIRVSFEIAEFFQVKIGAGVSLRLNGVQIIKLVEFGGGDAEYHGFADEGMDDDAETDEEEDEEDEQPTPPKRSAKKASAKKTPAPAPADDDDEEEEEEEDEDF